MRMSSEDKKKSSDAFTIKLVPVLIIIALLVTTYARNAIWQDDITLWKDVIKKSPDKARVRYNLGFAYAGKGLYDMAIENYSGAIALNPKFIEAYNNRGIAYELKGQYDAAIDDYNMAIAINPKSAEAYYNRGNAYLHKGQNNIAIEDFQKACNMRSEGGCKNMQTLRKESEGM